VGFIDLRDFYGTGGCALPCRQIIQDAAGRGVSFRTKSVKNEKIRAHRIHRMLLCGVAPLRSTRDTEFFLSQSPCILFCVFCVFVWCGLL